MGFFASVDASHDLFRGKIESFHIARITQNRKWQKMRLKEITWLKRWEMMLCLRILRFSRMYYVDTGSRHLYLCTWIHVLKNWFHNLDWSHSFGNSPIALSMALKMRHFAICLLTVFGRLGKPTTNNLHAQYWQIHTSTYRATFQ